jgi:ABC-type nitrate/sulfonate/bicarbonate transport system substrate-binding protein
MTRQDLVDKDSASLERFLKAALRGIQDAKDNPEAATDIVMQFAPSEDRGHQLAMLKVELDMADGPVTREKGLGFTTTAQWQAYHDSLLTYGGISKPIDVNSVFTTKMLEQIYRGGHLVWP